MKSLVYIHGFNSAPQSIKAQLTKRYFEQVGRDFSVHVASFPAEPSVAIESIRAQTESLGLDNVAGFIGSSLGGYYSLYLHHVYNKPAVLVNPAIRPYKLLSDYIGINTNWYTGKTYHVTAEHMQQLRDIDRVAQADPNKLFLLTQTADEVLDYREATTALPQAKVWITRGGDHAYSDFEEVLPAIERFFYNSCSAHSID